MNYFIKVIELIYKAHNLDAVVQSATYNKHKVLIELMVSINGGAPYKEEGWTFSTIQDYFKAVDVRLELEKAKFNRLSEVKEAALYHNFTYYDINYGWNEKITTDIVQLLAKE